MIVVKKLLKDQETLQKISTKTIIINSIPGVFDQTCSCPCQTLHFNHIQKQWSCQAERRSKWKILLPKVAVYNCASFTNVRVLCYSTTSKHKLLSMNVDIATLHATTDSCFTSQIVQLRASCVEYACGSDVHVTVQSRHEQRQKTVATGALPPLSPGINLLLPISILWIQVILVVSSSHRVTI